MDSFLSDMRHEEETELRKKTEAIGGQILLQIHS